MKTTNCQEWFRALAQWLVNTLCIKPDRQSDADSYVLIDFLHNRVSDSDLQLVIQLCSVAIQSKLFWGLNQTTIMEAGSLLSSFRNYLDRYEIVATEEDYTEAYCQYYSVRLQLFHLIGDYSSVKKEYEKRLITDDIILSHGKRIVSQYTASKWVGSLNQHERKLSRDVAEDLMSHVQNKGISAEADYFIAAKYLEHHIQSNTPAEGLRQVGKLLSVPLDEDDIPSAQDAISQTILYRDLYEASMRARENETKALAYLGQAKRIADSFNLRDQQNKIRKVEQELSEENTKTKYYVAHADQFTVVEGDMKGSIVHGVQSPNKVDYTSLKADIQRLMNSGTDAEKQALQEAVSAIDEKNESKFKAVLKKIADMFGDVVTNVSSELLIAYMRQNGLLP